MNNSKQNIEAKLVFPVLALLCASFTGVAMVGMRTVWTHHLHFIWLIWNLFLAWLPLLFALGVRRRHDNGARNDWRLYSLAGLWLLFLPNAPYIFTDLIHVNHSLYGHAWLDLSMILLFALTGFMLGFVSLYLMQSVVVDRFGKAAGWLFVFITAGLCSLGVYLGRFQRWNSWDAILHPLGVSRNVGHLAVHPLAHSHSIAFAVLFAVFLFLGYLMLYALTHVPSSRTDDNARA